MMEIAYIVVSVAIALWVTYEVGDEFVGVLFLFLWPLLFVIIALAILFSPFAIPRRKVK